MSDNGKPLRIIELQAENVKRLKAVRIRPDRTLVKIEGRNAQGKTSVLDAVAAALGGGKWNPEEPVRKGEKKASVKLDLGELQVERRWTAKGHTVLEVTANGARLATPQAILDKLVGDLTFDPLAFLRMKPKDQADVLRRLAGLDFTEIDKEHDRLYAERTIANRMAKEAQARVGEAPAEPASDEPISVAELAKEQELVVGNNRKVDEAEKALTDQREAVAERKLQLQEAEHQCQIIRNAIASFEEGERLAAEKLASMKRQDVSDLAMAITEAEKHNRLIEARENWKTRRAEAGRLAADAEELDDMVKNVDAEKERRLAAAKFPLDGLGIDVSGPTLNGVPFSQASSAEQLRTGVAIGLAEKTRARIILIRDGSLLDTENLDALNRIAEEFDAQVFLERVAEEASPSAVYIEDGEIVEPTHANT
jgi:DNA repair exonuclease SbcCD ATPase subunit